VGITDQLLMAYVDGELSPDLAALILERLTNEPELLERLEEHQRLRGELSALYEPVIGEPLPASLTELIAREGVAGARTWTAPARGFDFDRLWNAWPMVASAAAAALVGLGLSEVLHARDPLARSPDGRIMASGSLARSLENDLAPGATGSDAKILASFEDRSGQYCRVFQTGGGHEDGVACKNGGRWLIVALANATGSAPAQGYRQASSALAASIATAVDELQASNAMSPDQERRARTEQWRGRPAAAPRP
jgi:hypothetical protein